MAEIHIGIINYNGGPHLKKCIDSIFALNAVSPKIFVFDNASQDDSLSSLQGREGVEIIRSEKNLGYAGACNELLKRMDSEIVVLSNMDVTYHQDWAVHIQKAFEDEIVSSVASLFLHEDEAQGVNWAGSRYYNDFNSMSFWSGEAVDKVPNTQKEIVDAYGAVMTFRKKVIDQVGYMDDDYFLFFEETEFFWRLFVQGYKTIYEPSAIIYHERSLSTVRYSTLKLFYSERNRIWTAFKYLPFRYFVTTFFYAVKRFYTLNKKAGGDSNVSYKSSKVQIILSLGHAWLQGLLFLPREWGKRKRIWKNAKRSQKEVLRRFQENLVSLDELHI